MTPHSFAPINVVDGLHFALRINPCADLGISQHFGLKVEFQGVTGPYSRSRMSVRSNPKKPLDENTVIIICHKKGGLKIDPS